MAINAGDRGDSPRFVPVLERIRVLRPGWGPPPDPPGPGPAPTGSSQANRACLRRRQPGTITIKRDRQTNQLKRGSHGGRPSRFAPRDLPRRRLGAGHRAPGDDGGEPVELARPGTPVMPRTLITIAAMTQIAQVTRGRLSIPEVGTGPDRRCPCCSIALRGVFAKLGIECIADTAAVDPIQGRSCVSSRAGAGSG
jgi:hypothetical protein